MILPGMFTPTRLGNSLNSGTTRSNLSQSLLSFPQGNALPTGGNYIYVNVKQYKGIIRRRNARKAKYAKKVKLTIFLPKLVTKKVVTEVPQMRQRKQIGNDEYSRGISPSKCSR